MNSRKKIINELRFQLDSKEVKDQHYPVQLSASDANAILALLKDQEPRVMTLEEVIHSGNDMMWIEIKCSKPPYFMLEPTSPYTDNDKRWLYVRFQSGHTQSKGLYGRQWRCWNTRPTDEQRKAAKWND